MTKKIMEGFDINAALAIVDKMEKEIKYEQQVVSVIRMIADAKGVDRERESTNAAIIKEIERNKGYLAEAETKAREMEMKVVQENEKAEIKIAAEKEIVKEKLKTIDRKFSAQQAEWEEKAVEVERAATLRINTAKIAAKAAEKEAAEASTKKGEMEEAFRLVKDKYLSV